MHENLTIIDHPLVQHKLSLMRDKETSTRSFRILIRETGTLLAYEVTKDLPLITKEIETPLMKMNAPFLEGKKLCLVSILRAGNGLLDGFLDLVPSSRVGHIGLYRDPPASRKMVPPISVLSACWLLRKGLSILIKSIRM